MKRACVVRVPWGNGFYFRNRRLSATVQVHNLWYCAVHDPAKIIARRELGAAQRGREAAQRALGRYAAALFDVLEELHDHYTPTNDEAFRRATTVLDSARLHRKKLP